MEGGIFLFKETSPKGARLDHHSEMHRYPGLHRCPALANVMHRYPQFALTTTLTDMHGDPGITTERFNSLDYWRKCLYWHWAVAAKIKVACGCSGSSQSHSKAWTPIHLHRCICKCVHTHPHMGNNTHMQVCILHIYWHIMCLGI